MRLTALLLFVGAGLALAAAPSSQDVLNEDAARLQGIWSIVSVEVEGQSLAMDKLQGASLSIRGSQYSFKLDQTRLELSFKLDSGKRPKAIDLEIMEGPEKGKVYHGIYKLDKGTYTICRTTMPGKERPTAFVTRPNSGLMLVVWKQIVTPFSERADALATEQRR